MAFAIALNILINDCKEFISNGLESEAVELLLDKLKDDADIRDQVIILKNNLLNIKKHQINQTISVDQYNLSRNKVLVSLINLVDEIDEEDLKDYEQEKKKQEEEIEREIILDNEKKRKKAIKEYNFVREHKQNGNLSTITIDNFSKVKNIYRVCTKIFAQKHKISYKIIEDSESDLTVNLGIIKTHLVKEIK